MKAKRFIEDVIGKIVENKYEEMILIVTDKSKNIPDDIINEIDDLSTNGIMISPKHGADDVPIAWDASFEIKGDKVVITGGVGPSGYGDVVITLPAKDFTKIYNVTLSPNSEENYNKIVDLLNPLGYLFK